MNEKRAEFCKLCAGKPMSAVSKMAGEAWKKLSEPEKAPYQKSYGEAKTKFEADMAVFIAAGGVKSKGVMALRAAKRKAKEGGGKAKRAKKDADAPKRPAGGAFGCFLAANRQAFQKECPGAVTLVTKHASAKWKELSQAEKEKYEMDYKSKKAAYDEAMKSYVPPAKEADEDDKEEQGDEEADKKPKSESLAKKKASANNAAQKKVIVRKSVGSRGRGASKAAPEPELDIPKTVSEKAEQSGMHKVLMKLLGRDDIKSSGVSPKDALAALEQSDGLLHKAREALLAAGA